MNHAFFQPGVNFTPLAVPGV